MDGRPISLYIASKRSPKLIAQAFDFQDGVTLGGSGH
jgi:hypothetical protein